ncbi:Thiamine-phosphate synthase [Nymphon striatum]|nr:Thiamine-phosphate synthase [Nymphon striatum]
MVSQRANMPVESHIDSLKMRHQELDHQLEEMKVATSVDQTELRNIKQKKLAIKDKIEPFCKDVTPQLQEADCAVLIADDTQAFGRCGADGLFVEKEKSKLEDFIARFSPQNIVGCGNIKARHNALEIGELKPDFMFFGKLGGDIKPEAHPKNIKLAEWWAELVEIPGIVMGGSALNSIIEVAKTGIDFVALEKAVFADGDAAKNVVEANALLDAHAPSFDEDEE